MQPRALLLNRNTNGRGSAYHILLREHVVLAQRGRDVVVAVQRWLPAPSNLTKDAIMHSGPHRSFQAIWLCPWTQCAGSVNIGLNQSMLASKYKFINNFITGLNLTVSLLELSVQCRLLNHPDQAHT